ncbi:MULTISPECIES: hypothetical protein [unclassified Actinomyces]|uniref:hypothetical protein n=1 Tax=unclassified Actinomyces TaxID=2609248 RepID=UPI0020179F6E|nr:MULTISPECIES: hypothetical protein [unclassified Actinomyces]MCL3777271.1 hypothetical protein [Actinomyces sp. AC-20-1]MCL3789917.1 hypothetical protein [Actinomyces sp. 187325]MCL3792133.1 hypothetical protein [Actinomyces sp. 186855]MCL3793633.1 hypothetical protein [Actinomyces sp. 217892]
MRRRLRWGREGNGRARRRAAEAAAVDAELGIDASVTRLLDDETRAATGAAAGDLEESVPAR